MFDVRHLRLITALAQEGTAAAVAAKLGFSPAAVSQQLAAMSRIAGHPLTRKEGRRLVLTSAGETLANHAEEILAAMALMEAEVATAGAATPRLRVATFPSGGCRFVVPALAELRTEMPTVELQVVEAEPEAALPLLKQGIVDVAVTYSYSLRPHLPDSSLTLNPLTDQPMSFVCDDEVATRLRHGLTQARQVLQDIPWIAGPIGSDDREVLRRVCATIGFEPHVHHSVDDYTLTLTMVAAGMGVSLVPLAAVTSIPQRVRTFPVPGSAPVRHVWAVTQRGHERREGVAAVVEALKSAAMETVQNFIRD